MTALAMIYGLSNVLLSFAWWHLLGHFGASTRRCWAVRAYGISQIAKYVPGNIFHLAGRQTIGMAAGVPGWALAKSAMWEVGLIATAGILFVPLTLPFLPPHFPILASGGFFITMLGVSALLMWRFIGPPVVWALGWQVVFLAISGLVFVGIIELQVKIAGREGFIIFPIVGAYVLAWLSGFVTPGSPAGLGIRELVLLFLLNGIVGGKDLLVAVVLGRIVSVSGDIVFFAVVSLINIKIRIFDET